MKKVCVGIILVVCVIVLSNFVVPPPAKAANPVLTLTYGNEHKYYTLNDLLALDPVTGNGGRIKSTGEVIPPNAYTGVLMTTFAQEFPDMSSRYNVTSISNDGYIVNYTYNQTQGEVMVYDLNGIPIGVGGVDMILATKENGQTNYSGSLRIAFINDDEPITDSFLWAKYVVELVFSPPPHRPDTPSGETTGKVGVIYTYSTSTIEPYEGQVYYLWDWGDGTTSKWLGPCDSGASCQASHIWTKKDAYAIKVKAKNIHDTESNWSDPLPISMPQNNAFTPLLQVLQYLERLFERFPNAFPFLRHLMGD